MSPDYARHYLFIGLLTLVALVLAIAPLLLSKLVAPKKPGRTKTASYECGLEATGDPWSQFRVQYYLYALLFVVFDVEVVFLYPWALVWKGLGGVALAELAVFLAILAVGLVYAWKKGLLEWR